MKASLNKHAEKLPRLAFCQTRLACEVQVHTVDMYLGRVLSRLISNTPFPSAAGKLHNQTKCQLAENIHILFPHKTGPAHECRKIRTFWPPAKTSQNVGKMISKAAREAGR